MNHEPHEPHERLLCRDEVFGIQGAIFEVNRVLGVGFLEAAYQESLALEFQTRGIPFTAQPTLSSHTKGRRSAPSTFPTSSASSASSSS